MLLFYLIECACYIFYIYSLCLLFIVINPNKLVILLFFLYCFFSSWYIINGCRSILEKNKYLKTMILLFYSVFCVFVYLIINKTWKNKHIRCVMLMMPFGYFIQIRIFEYIFGCKPYHVITYPLRLI